MVRSARRFAQSIMLAALALVASLAATPASAASLIRDSEIEAILEGYARPLLEAAQLRPQDVQIYIVQDSTLNAFVTGGQNIFIHTGLILEAETPSQLKGVIAHEIGHISGGHLTRSREAMQQAMTPAYISIGLGILAIAAGAPDAGAALIGGSQQFAIASYLRYSQVQESSADQAGATFLQESGQSSDGLLQFFENFRYQEVVAESRRNPYFRSHPLSSDRIEALRQRVNTNPNRGRTDTPKEIEDFARMQAKLYGFLQAPQQTFTKYAPKDMSIPARYARAVAAYRVPDIETATKETRALIEAEPNDPYFNELLAQILFEGGRSEESVAPARRALTLKPNDPLLQIALARALIASDKRAGADEAVTLLEGALRTEPDNAYAWRELASAHALRGEDGLARLASAELAYSVGDILQANSFANRAKRALPQGSTSWQRAADIVNVTENVLRESGGRRGRG